MAVVLRLLACVVSLCVVWTTPAAAQHSLVLRQALIVESEAARFPADAAVQPVLLPDDPLMSRPGHGGATWYRFAFDPADAPRRGELQALFVERACAAFEVRLNDTLLHVADHATIESSAGCRRSQLVALPARLLRTGHNLLDVKVALDTAVPESMRPTLSGLAAVEVGPYAQMALRQAVGPKLGLGIPQALSAALLLLTAVLLTLGRASRRQKHVFLFGLLTATWALLTAQVWWRDTPLPVPWADAIEYALLAVATLAAVLFALRHTPFHSRVLTVALGVQCVLAPAVLLAAGTDAPAVAGAWQLIFAAQVLAAVACMAWRSHARRPTLGRHILVLLCVSFLVGLEIVARQRPLEGWAVVLAHAGLPLLFAVAGLRLIQQYGRALVTAEQGRMSLESSIRDATAEIERNFAQLAELRVEQVTERERKRIAADLHDDLGAKLLTIVHTSESERISTLAREALEEMRLSVRGLTGKPVRLIDALGDWRAEIVARLAQAGVEADWTAPAEDLSQTLSARAYVQTTRILREAVSNIIKHSGASHCSVRSSIAEGDFQLLIQDNGRGIPLELDGRLDRGHGMASMKRRAKQLAGQCLVESGPGYGTVIRLTLPLEARTTKV